MIIIRIIISEIYNIYLNKFFVNFQNEVKIIIYLRIKK